MGSNQVPAFKDVYVRINPDFEIAPLSSDGPERGHLCFRERILEGSPLGSLIHHSLTCSLLNIIYIVCS